MRHDCDFCKISTKILDIVLTHHLYHKVIANLYNDLLYLLPWSIMSPTPLSTWHKDSTLSTFFIYIKFKFSHQYGHAIFDLNSIEDSGYVLIPTRDWHAFSIPVKYIWHTSTYIEGVARNKVTARLKKVKTRRECLCSFFSHFFIPTYRYGIVKSWTVSPLPFLFTCFIEMRPNKLRTLCASVWRMRNRITASDLQHNNHTGAKPKPPLEVISILCVKLAVIAPRGILHSLSSITWCCRYHRDNSTITNDYFVSFFCTLFQNTAENGFLPFL